jgi:hypothetical protein
MGNPRFVWHLALALMKGERRPMHKRPVLTPVAGAEALARIPRHRTSAASERGYGSRAHTGIPTSRTGVSNGAGVANSTGVSSNTATQGEKTWS